MSHLKSWLDYHNHLLHMMNTPVELRYYCWLVRHFYACINEIQEIKKSLGGKHVHELRRGWLYFVLTNFFPPFDETLIVKSIRCQEQCVHIVCVCIVIIFLENLKWLAFYSNVFDEQMKLKMTNSRNYSWINSESEFMIVSFSFDFFTFKISSLITCRSIRKLEACCAKSMALLPTSGQTYPFLSLSGRLEMPSFRGGGDCKQAQEFFVKSCRWRALKASWEALLFCLSSFLRAKRIIWPDWASLISPSFWQHTWRIVESGE